MGGNLCYHHTSSLSYGGSPEFVCTSPVVGKVLMIQRMDTSSLTLCRVTIQAFQYRGGYDYCRLGSNKKGEEAGLTTYKGFLAAIIIKSNGRRQCLISCSNSNKQFPIDVWVTDNRDIQYRFFLCYPKAGNVIVTNKGPFLWTVARFSQALNYCVRILAVIVNKSQIEDFWLWKSGDLSQIAFGGNGSRISHSRAFFRGISTGISLSFGLCISISACQNKTCGPNCNNRCQCANDVTCDDKTGKCSSGCNDRFTGRYCNIRKYGEWKWNDAVLH
jgi:hypothetical protein